MLIDLGLHESVAMERMAYMEKCYNDSRGSQMPTVLMEFLKTQRKKIEKEGTGYLHKHSNSILRIPPNHPPRSGQDDGFQEILLKLGKMN